jgi:Phosphate-selective porin O and P
VNAASLFAPSVLRSAIHRVALTMLVALAACATARDARAASPDSTAAPAMNYPAPPPTIPLPKVGGYIQMREIAQPNIVSTALLNRVRASIEGPLPSRFSYRLLFEMQASAGARNPATPSLREAIIRWNPEPFTLAAGEFKTPFSREYLIPVPQLELGDLAVVIDSLAPKYDVGVQADYALGPYANISAGMFNGEGANSIANRDSVMLFVGRVTARPLPQLALGTSGTYEGGDSLRWGVDAVVQQFGAMVRAEYITRHLKGRESSKDDFGWYFLETLRLVPRLQLVARQEDFQRPAQGVSKRIRSDAYAANLEIAPNRVRLMVEYLRRNTGPKQLRNDFYIGQIQVQF